MSNVLPLLLLLLLLGMAEAQPSTTESSWVTGPNSVYSDAETLCYCLHGLFCALHPDSPPVTPAVEKRFVLDAYPAPTQWPPGEPSEASQDYGLVLEGPSEPHTASIQQPLVLQSLERLEVSVSAKGKDIGGWAFGTYHPGDRTIPPVPPVSPVTSHQTPSRRPRAPSKRKPKEKGAYTCSVCSSSFDRQCDLNRHQRTLKDHETANRPYSCGQCNRTFLYPKDRDRHEETHTRQAKPRLCPIRNCEGSLKGFGRKDNLTRHMKTKHNAKYREGNKQFMIVEGMTYFVG